MNNREFVEDFLNNDPLAGLKYLLSGLGQAAKETGEEIKDTGKKIKKTAIETANDIATSYQNEINKIKQQEEFFEKLRDDLNDASVGNADNRNKFMQEVKAQCLKEHPVTQGVEYVINGALLNCNCSGVANNDWDNLAVLGVPGHQSIYASNDVIMDDSNSIPIKNINFKFVKCKSKSYEENIGEIYRNLINQAILFNMNENVNPGQSELAKYQAAIVEYGKTKATYCLHPIVERWVDPDDNIDFNNFFDHLYIAFAYLNKLVDSIKNWMQEISYSVDSSYNLYTNESEMSIFLYNQTNGIQQFPSGIWNDIVGIQITCGQIKKQITTVYDKLLKDFSNCTLNFQNGLNFKAQIPGIINHLSKLKSKSWTQKKFTNYNLLMPSLNKGLSYQDKKINEENLIDAFMETVQACLIMNYQRQHITDENLSKWFGEGTSWYNDLIDDIISELQKLNNALLEKPRHPIKKDSFLVCRLGGKITVQDAGQWFYYAKEMICPNFQIMLYDISEQIFGTRQENGEFGNGGQAGFYNVDGQFAKSENDKKREENSEMYAEFFCKMKVCLELLEKLSKYPEFKLDKKEDCPLFVKITIYPQNMIDDQLNEIAIFKGFLSASVGALSVLTGSGVIVGIGIGLTIIFSAENIINDNVGPGEYVNAADVGMTGVNEAVKRLAMEGSKLVKNVASVSTGISGFNVVYTFLSTCALFFENSSDRFYPGKTEIQFIGVNKSYVFTQEYDRQANLVGKLKSIAMGNEYYDETKFIQSMHPGLYTDNEEISKIYPEYEYSQKLNLK